MNEETTPLVTTEAQDLAPAVVPSESAVVEKEGGNVAVTALVPSDMQTCQSALKAWTDRKIAELESDANELRGAYEHALAKKWKSGTFKSHLMKVEKRIVFYQKMRAALEHGYVIVPNFPVQLFLIRTSKEQPLSMFSESDYNQDLKQSSQVLAIGEGGYENPFPVVKSVRVNRPTERDPNRTTFLHHATEWDEIDFPLAMSKPEIMEAVTRTMALNIFDQIGILPASRKEDPLIIGQLIDPRDKWQGKLVSFMIAWHLDTRVL